MSSSPSSSKKLHFNLCDDLTQPSYVKKRRSQRHSLLKPDARHHHQSLQQPTSVSADKDEKPAKNCVRRKEIDEKKIAKGSKTPSTSKVPKEDPTLKANSKRREVIPEEGKKSNKEKLSISLTKREIEEDFFSITGKKPPRNKKKRDKSVQKSLDVLFPGLSLDGHNAESLRVDHDSFFKDAK